MSEITFGPSSGASEAPIIDAAPAVVVPAALPVSTRRTSSLPGFSDVIFPHINIVHPLSKTAAIFPVGGVTFAEKTLLFQPPLINKETGNLDRPALPPVGITVIDFKPIRFVEKVSSGFGDLVNSEEAVVAAGGTTDWSEWNLKKAAGMKLFQVLAEAVVAIERPDHVADDDTVFVYKIGDKKYTLAIWSMKGSVYTEAAKRVLFYHRTSGCLIQGYPTWSFNLSTKNKDFKTGHSSWIPVLTPRTRSTPEFLAFAANLVGQI